MKRLLPLLLLLSLLLSGCSALGQKKATLSQERLIEIVGAANASMFTADRAYGKIIRVEFPSDPQCLRVVGYPAPSGTEANLDLALSVDSNKLIVTPSAHTIPGFNPKDERLNRLAFAINSRLVSAVAEGQKIDITRLSYTKDGLVITYKVK